MSVQSVLFVHLTFLYGPPPHAPGDLCGTVVPAATRRRSVLHPVQGGRPFRARLRIAPGYLLPLTQTDLPLWVGEQIGLFSPQATPGSHFLLSIRGAAEEPPRMLEGLSHHNQYR